MYRYTEIPRLATALAVILTLLFPVAGAADTRLDYQDRGDYHEGVRPFPVSGYDLELISVMSDYRETTGGLPDALRIRFYLPRKANVHITVRELDNKYYYWLDRIDPATSWKVGFGNMFQWSTLPVLRQLESDMDAYGLSALVRLDQAAPGAVERVAPAILYHDNAPVSLAAYNFTLKPSNDVRVVCSVAAQGQAEPVWKEVFRRKIGGRPFTVRWDASGAEAGDYTFKVFGYFLDTNRPVEQVVHFFHEPTVK